MTIIALLSNKGSSEPAQMDRLGINFALDIRGMFEMNFLLSYISISTWGTIKTNIYLYRFIQGLHNGV